jgi:hypothetical protein
MEWKITMIKNSGGKSPSDPSLWSAAPAKNGAPSKRGHFHCDQQQSYQRRSGSGPGYYDRSGVWHAGRFLSDQHRRELEVESAIHPEVIVDLSGTSSQSPI